MLGVRRCSGVLERGGGVSWSADRSQCEFTHSCRYLHLPSIQVTSTVNTRIGVTAKHHQMEKHWANGRLVPTHCCCLTQDSGSDDPTSAPLWERKSIKWQAPPCAVADVFQFISGVTSAGYPCHLVDVLCLKVLRMWRMVVLVNPFQTGTRFKSFTVCTVNGNILYICIL